MDQAIIDEILEELSSTLQKVEAQSSAILEFVKDKNIVKQDELAPYLERANAASSVRWRATRVRLEKLLSGLEKRQQHQDEERKRVESMHETAESNAGTTAEQKSVAKPGAQTEKTQREEEKHEPAQSTKPREPDQKHVTTQPDQATHAESSNDPAAARSTEQPPSKSQQPDAA